MNRVTRRFEKKCKIRNSTNSERQHFPKTPPSVSQKHRRFSCSLTLIGKSWKTHPEIFLKFSFSGSSHRPFYWKTHPVFFSKFQFWGVTQAVLLENSSIKNHGYLFSFFNSGASHRPFYWKTHPLKIMSTYSVFSILGRHTGRFTGKLIH